MAKVSLLSKARQPLGWASDEELRDILNRCLAGSEKRHSVYNNYRQLVYDDSKRNLLYKFLREMVSLLYVSDNIIFDIQLQGKGKADEALSGQVKDLKRRIENDFSDKGLDVQIYRWVFNSLLYGSYFVKCIIDGDDVSLKSVSPYDISVLYEDIPSFDEPEQVVVHTVRIPEHLARRKYPGVPIRKAELPYKDVGRFMDIISRSGDAVRSTVVDTGVEESFIPKNVGSYFELYEMWMWDVEANDYVMVQFIGDTVKRYKNPFIPKMHPFVRLCINSIEEYFWGMSELYYIKNIQDKISNQEQILQYLQTMLLSPVMVVYGISSTIESKEIQEKLKKAGEVVEIIDPTSKIDFYLPKLDPSLVQSIMKYYEENFIQQTSVTGMLTGRGMPSVRSAKHAQLVAQFASAGLRDKALVVEYFIEKLMTLYATAVSVVEKDFSLMNAVDFKVDVFAHTSSPIIAMSYQEMLFSLTELGLIKPDVLIDILPIPKKHEIKGEA